MYLRPDLDLTLDGLHEQIGTQQDEAALPQEIASEDLAFNLTADTPTIRVGAREVPVTERGLLAFGGWLQVPDPFLRRLHAAGPDLSQTVLTGLLERTAGSSVAVLAGEGGVIDVRDPGQIPVNPLRIVNLATRILGPEAPVQRLIDTPGEFSFDAHIPFDSGDGVVGDGTVLDLTDDSRPLIGRSYAPGTLADGAAQVNDITAAGLRFGYDRKRNLAPWVQPWMFRLICTNGMETTDTGLRIDARGATTDDILIELEAAAQRAFGRIEEQIKHFYDLRNTPVESNNPERYIRRIGRERGIPARSIEALLTLAPSDELPDNPSVFDVVNLITNQANNPALRRDGGRLILERAGGTQVTEHAARCGHCHIRTDI